MGEITSLTCVYDKNQSLYHRHNYTTNISIIIAIGIIKSIVFTPLIITPWFQQIDLIFKPLSEQSN